MVSRPTDDLKQATRSSTRYLYTALAALVLFVAIDTFQADIAISLHLFVGLLLFFSTIFLAIYAAVSRKNRRRCLQQLATLAIFLAVLTASFFFNRAYFIGRSSGTASQTCCPGGSCDRERSPRFSGHLRSIRGGSEGR